MRVAIATDRIGGLSSDAAGTALGEAFARVPGRSVQVAVVPLASAGQDLAEALRTLEWPGVVVRSVEELPDALAARPVRVVLDLDSPRVPDGGAELLSALGARADVPLDAGVDALAGLTRLDLGPALDAVADTELVAVVPTEEAEDLLLGIGGLAARRAFAEGVHVGVARERDSALATLAGAAGVTDEPGLGAVGGIGLAVRSLGGRVTTRVRLCAEAARLPATLAQADVVVTGSDRVDFASRGGDVVVAVAAWAAEVMRPCIAVAREVHVSSRELRTFGIESAHALGGPPHLAASELTRRAAGVAASWTW